MKLSLMQKLQSLFQPYAPPNTRLYTGDVVRSPDRKIVAIVVTAFAEGSRFLFIEHHDIGRIGMLGSIIRSGDECTLEGFGCKGWEVIR